MMIKESVLEEYVDDVFAAMQHTNSREDVKRIIASAILDAAVDSEVFKEAVEVFGD